MELTFELPPSGFKRIFYDIETSYCVGSFWRPSYKARITYDNIIIPSAIICISYKYEGQDKVSSLIWNEGDDKTVVERFLEIVNDCDEVVSHNGLNFDDKWVRTRAMEHRIPCPAKFKSFDTLKKLRSHVKLDSNRLDFIGQRYLGEGKSPMSFEDWNNIIKPLIPKLLGFDIELPDSYHEALDKMVKYCEKDVELLERAFHYIQPYVDHNIHVGASEGFGRYACPSCAHDQPAYQRKRVTKAGTTKHDLRCTKCKRYYVVSHKVWMEKLEADYNEKQRQK